jgi:uncharacterized repeat protein (TIGR01451 family)
MGARTRRGLALSWSALFVLSMLLQYFSFALAPAALAVHDEGLFELDGDTIAQNASAPIGPAEDWDSHPGATGNRALFVTDPLSQQTDDIYTGGSTKDDLNTTGWKWTTGSVPDKDNIEHAFAVSYDKNGHTFVYFGLDRYANNGDAFTGFWFFKGGVGPVAGGSFSGAHQVGDLLVLSNFTNGGATATIQLYEWVGAGNGEVNGTLHLLGSGQECTGAPADDRACAVTNSGPINPSWTFDDKGTAGSNNPIPADSFFEGGIDLDQLFGGNAPCFGSFIAETRASQSVDAVLKDFAGGSFNTCVPPTIATTSSRATADFGQQVTDTANLSGNDGNASGTVKFFICTPAQITAAGCPTGSGTQVGLGVAVDTSGDPDTATSAAYTVGLTAAAAGKYCWRAEYAPDANSQYLAGTHTNATTECFTVAPATIEIHKTANPAGPVSAGTDIGFDITVHNNGTQTTLNPNLSDPLPGGVDWTLGTVTGGASCAITGPVGTEVLACTKASLAADASYSVHVSAGTDKTDCGTITNSAHVSTSNDGSGDASDSVVVRCPDIKVTKTPDGGSVDAGGTITWSIKVENIGAGDATGVVATDNLPAGIHWTESETDCSIAGADDSQVLTCTVGALAAGASKTYQVSGVTDKADCGPVNNTASATATNEPSNVLANNSDSGSVTVLCATVTIGKTANPVGPVSAGTAIGFDLTWGNSTGGKATGVVVTDTLPTVAGVNWSISSFTGTGSTCVIAGSNPQVLTCNVGDIAGNTAVSGTVHITSATTAQSCGVVDNTGHVTTTNDGSAQASASVTVLCPDLEVVKSGNGPLNAGDPATFTITLTNHGPGAAANTTLTDQLPSGTWTLGGADKAACSISGANLLSCDFGTVANGGTRTITVTKTTTAVDCSGIHNEVTVAATNENTATDQFANTDDADIVVNCPDVHVLKTADTGTISAGQVAAFTIKVSNDGVGTAKNVTLHDVLPGGVAWTIDPAVQGCAIANNVLDCSFTTLASGASVTIHISGTTSNANCAGLDNTAVVAASNEPQADQSDNSSSASIDVNCPDIGVTKTADIGTISAGDTAAFTVTVTNHGPGTAFNVHVADTLPAGVTWSLDPTVAGCAIVGTALTCDFTTLADGASVVLHIKGETKAANCGTLDNDVIVSASNEVPDDQFPNEASADITVLCPTIVITKTADKDTVSAGDGIGFVIEVTNTGAGSAFNVAVSDTLPTNAGLGWSIDAANSSPGWSISNGVLSFGPATLAGSASTHVHIVSGTSAATCGDVPNLASVTFTGGTGSDDSTITVECPDINVLKTPDNGTVNAGQNAVFTIVVSNSAAAGTGTARDVTLTDNLPAGYVWSIGGADKADCSINTVPSPDVLSCDFGDLAPGESRTITLTAPTTGSNCAVIPNTATVAASNEGQDKLANNSDSASVDVLCADISIAKVANPEGPVNAGDTIGFDITVTNSGDGTATGVVMTDELPAGIDWSAGDPSGDTDGVVCAIESGTLTCTDDAMAPTDSFTIHISGDTTAANCGTVDNTASVTTGNDGSDEASASVDVLCPDVKVVKDAVNTPISVGQDLVYSITTSNIGDGVAYDVVLKDTLPAGFDWTVDDTDDCSITAGVLTCDLGDIAPGGSVKVTLTAPTSADPETGNIDCSETLVHEIPNVASASADNEGSDVLGNNEDGATITVLCSALGIDKSFTGNTNGTDPDLGVPSANIGDTLHYTLHYTGAGPIADATITDVLPQGLAYVNLSAAGDANFTFDSYNPATRTLTWVAAEGLPDPADGTVTYDVKVLATAPDFPQPLVNIATIVGHTPTGSELTDSDTAAVAVLAPPEELTPPPTSTLTPQTGTGNPGFALMLILLGVAGLALAIGFITPAPARVRRRDRLG